MDITENFTNILKATAQNKQPYVIKQLQIIANKIKYTEDVNERYKADKTGVKTSDRVDVLEKCIDVLKLHGYMPHNLFNYKDKFIDFMLNNTLNLEKFKPELITFNILNSLQEAYYMYLIEFDKEPETYYVLRDFLFNWENVINEKSKKELEALTHGI